MLKHFGIHPADMALCCLAGKCFVVEVERYYCLLVVCLKLDEVDRGSIQLVDWPPTKINKLMSMVKLIMIIVVYEQLL